MSRKISLKDIASAVGVSTALVSYVLNNKKEGRISKEVAEKIRTAAREMNYRTNQIARSLKTNKTNTIGLILADISNPFSAALARVIEDAADLFGYTVIFGSSDENPEKYKKILDALVNRQVDGLIISPPEHAELEIQDLQHDNIPFVLIDRYFPGIDTSYVILDNYTAAFDATQHLIECGHTRIGMINYASSLFHLGERSRGYREAIAQNKIHFEPGYLQQVHTAGVQEQTIAAVDNLLQHPMPVTAMLFGTNIIAKHAVKHINERGLRIPKDLGLVCFDEAEVFDLFYAPLTYIEQPLKQMGIQAVQILLDQMASENSATQQASLKAKLVVRAS